MGSPDSFAENDGNMSTTTEQEQREQQRRYEQKQEDILKKFSAPAYREIRTRKNGTTMNGFKVKQTDNDESVGHQMAMNVRQLIAPLQK